MNKLIDLNDELYDLISLVEICRGYTQADAPDMAAFDVVLAKMYSRFIELYDEYNKIVRKDRDKDE